MPKHSETRTLPWSADQMYDLVADVGRYGEFLPWVSGVRIKSNSDTEMVADLLVGFKAIKEKFTSRVTKDRPRLIRVDYLDGPMKYLHNEWTFRDRADGGCDIDFMVDFQFKSRVFEAIAGQVFDRALTKMTDAFVARAEALYSSAPGNSSSSATSAA
jgi:coenzyme Q-binding protein COQ10